MALIRTFKDLIAWQKGMDVAEEVFHLTAGFPPDERFGLTAQVRKAAVAIASNVAEGFGRSSRIDYLRFIDIARGSANEVETQLLLAQRLGFLAPRTAKPLLSLVVEEQKILMGLAKSLDRSAGDSLRKT